jgi:16S rRNA processing protein RimM
MQQDRQIDLVVVGICSGPVGVHGEIKIRSFTDNPRRFVAGNTVIIKETPRQIEGARAYRRQLIVKFSGVDTLDLAQRLNNENICIREDAVEGLPEDQYYHFQLLGIKVTTNDGRHLGTLTEILTTGSNDVYVVKGEEEVLVPAISDVVVSVDVVSGEMIVDLPTGL